jgi:hypothetical protein
MPLSPRNSLRLGPVIICNTRTFRLQQPRQAAVGGQAIGRCLEQTTNNRTGFMRAADKEGAPSGSADRRPHSRTAMVTVLAGGLAFALLALFRQGKPTPAGARRHWVIPGLSPAPRFPPAPAGAIPPPWWGLMSAAAAPVLLVAGSAVAAALQPTSFNSLASTVSALAEPGAADRWVMTATFALAGACEVATAVALRSAATPGRLLLAAAGTAGVLVAANPEHPGGALAHAVWAATSFVALVTWPAAARQRGPSVAWGLRPAASTAATGVLLALFGWFLTELVTVGGMTGLAERVMGVAQAGWPLVVVFSCRLSRRVTRPCPANETIVTVGRADGGAWSLLSSRAENDKRWDRLHEGP